MKIEFDLASIATEADLKTLKRWTDAFHERVSQAKAVHEAVGGWLEALSGAKKK